MKSVYKLSKVEEEKASDLLKKAIVINMMDSTSPSSFDSRYCQKLVETGLTALNTTVNINIAFRPWESLPEVIRQFCIWYAKLEENSDKILQVTSAEDIKEAKKKRKIGVIFGFQNPKPIDQDPDLLTIFHRLGLRVCGLVYTRRNSFADGCGESTDCGLSRTGELVVERMNKLHVLMELSHCGHRSSLQAIELSKDPVVFSHSNARGIYDHVRNITDEQIKACAEKGGVVGVNAFSRYLHQKGDEEGATVEHALDHIDYIARLVGVDHVGIGTDSSEGRTAEEIMQLARAYPELRSAPQTVEASSIEKRYALKTILEFRNYERAGGKRLLGSGHTKDPGR